MYNSYRDSSGRRPLNDCILGGFNTSLIHLPLTITDNLQEYKKCKHLHPEWGIFQITLTYFKLKKHGYSTFHNFLFMIKVILAQ